MSNHLGDANKMVSDTPRTDEAYFKKGATMYDLAGEMKRMERELNAANERIKRLEEALAEIAYAASHPLGAGQSLTLGKIESIAIKAKEAKS